MKQEQLTVPIQVETKHGRLLKNLRRVPHWRNAVRLLLKDPRVQRARSHPALEIPPSLEQAWMIHASGIPFRCCVIFVPFPHDGTPPGFRGRVDVLCRYDK